MTRNGRNATAGAPRTGVPRSVPAIAPEQIRTYNFPQGRLTDHRIRLTLYKLDKVMTGEALDEVIDALVTQHQVGLLAAP